MVATVWRAGRLHGRRLARQGRSAGLVAVRLVGGPRTIGTFRRLGALDKLGLIVLPLLIGRGMRLTPSLGIDTDLTLESERALPGGPVEIVYAVSARAARPAGPD